MSEMNGVKRDNADLYSKWMFSLYDVKAELYSPPLCAASSGVLLRELQDAIKAGAQQPWAQHPEDFRLVLVGRYREDIGEMSPMKHQVVCELSSLVS